ncbi:hypothetical protein Tsubulata_008049 [Turnera subulata]|uniref:DUF4283 domain-containing protein n=1 Tax=Turnera subulata TaxID=218843 RepID=A0A9Q0FC50_9ROSI|nr:hypothetical protein Tsubulata_008049 [Turnera subulata]
MDDGRQRGLGKKFCSVPNPVEGEYEDLVFDDDEVKSGQTALNLCLVGTLWTERPFNVQAFMRTMKQVCKATHDVEISQLDKNLFIFQFHHWRDKERFLEQEPWNFNNQVVLLREIKGSEQPSKLSIFHVPIWVRANDIPLNYHKDRFAEQLGNRIRCFLQMDQDRSVSYGKFIRIRVVKDVRNPLLRGSRVTLKDDDDLLNPKLYQYGENLRASPLLCLVNSQGERSSGTVNSSTRRDKSDGSEESAPNETMGVVFGVREGLILSPSNISSSASSMARVSDNGQGDVVSGSSLNIQVDQEVFTPMRGFSQ